MMTPGFTQAGRATRLAAAGVAALIALIAPMASHAQLPAATTSASQAQAHPASAPASGARSAASSGSRTTGKARGPGPQWRDLNEGQHQALAPLASTWGSLNEAQKRKWLAVSANYPKMSPAEQEKLHSRMTEWIALTPQQRAIARLNYGETQKMAPDAKKAKWEAYQALSPEEKRKLAAGVAKPPTTAAAVRPVPPEKLATVPKPQSRQDSKAPRIAAAPHQADHHTVVPQQPQPPSSAGLSN